MAQNSNNKYIVRDEFLPGNPHFNIDDESSHNPNQTTQSMINDRSDPFPNPFVSTDDVIINTIANQNILNNHYNFMHKDPLPDQIMVMPGIQLGTYAPKVFPIYVKPKHPEESENCCRRNKCYIICTIISIIVIAIILTALIQGLALGRRSDSSNSSTTKPNNFLYNTAISSVLTTEHATYQRPNGKNSTYYYNQFRIYISNSDTYTFISSSNMDTIGYLYQNDFDPSSPSLNLISYDDDSSGNNQFRLSAYLRSIVNYYFVVTTFRPQTTGAYNLMVLGYSRAYITVSNPVTTTASYLYQSGPNISSTLTTNNPKYQRYQGSSSNYYFDIFLIEVPIEGYYMIRSNSTINNFGYIYSSIFASVNPTLNLVASDGRNGTNNQFQLSLALQPMGTYYLIVTTSNTEVTGSYDLLLHGPARFTLRNINQLLTKNAADYYISGTTIPTTLTKSSLSYIRPNSHGSAYYYEIFAITVQQANNYTFMSTGATDTYAYIYNDTFNSSNPMMHLFASDDQSGGYNQFQLTVFLQTDILYYFVVTTYDPGLIGAYNLVALGSQQAIFSRVNQTVLKGLTFQSYYTSILTRSSPTFEPFSYSDMYYYQAIQITVPQSGYYTFQRNTNIDSRSYLYEKSFNSSNASKNLLKSSYSFGGRWESLFTTTLNVSNAYVLVFTANSLNVTAAFTITVSGPEIPNFIDISTVSTTTSNSKDVTTERTSIFTITTTRQ